MLSVNKITTEWSNLRSKRANFVVSESRSKVYFDYAECEQNLDKNRYIRTNGL